MCVIVDANVAGLIFRQEPDGDFVPVFRWLHDPHGDGCLVFGGELAGELRRVRGGRSYLLQLSRAGRARQIPDVQVENQERCLERMGLCRSNDPHVLALARVSGARTLCSHDRDLERDFKDPDLISHPRGKVYKRPSHAHLLCHTQSCGLLQRHR